MPPEAALDAIATAIQDAPSIGAALDRAALALRSLIPYDRLTFVLFEPDGTRMAVRWTDEAGTTEWLDDAVRRPISMEGTPAEWVRASGRSLHEPDTNESRFDHHPVREAGRRSFLLVPVGVPPAGVIGWSTVAPGGFSADAIPLAEQVAALVADRLNRA
ncbi:MAG: GAF domain-containing protein [Dehalococcoidia bacterium]